MPYNPKSEKARNFWTKREKATFEWNMKNRRNEREWTSKQMTEIKKNKLKYTFEELLI